MDLKEKLLQPFVQGTSNVYAQNRLLKFCVIALLLVGLWNSVAIQRLQSNTQILVIPIGTASKFVLTGDTANDEYLTAMTRYVIDMIGNVTPPMARKQFGELLTLWDSSTYSTYKDRFDKMAKSLESYPSVSYHIAWDAGEGLKINGNTLRKRVVKKKMVGDTLVNKTILEYEITYRMDHGAFKIIDIAEVGGEQL